LEERTLELITVRAATIDDVEGIRSIHSACDDPWAHPGVGPVWVNHRLLRGFYIDVATVGSDVIGHAEWNLSDEPEPHGRFLYLGMLQIHAEHQRKGVGRAMIEAGLTRAGSLSCRALRTVPDENTCDFYAKSGFKRIGEVVSLELKTSDSRLPSRWSRVNRVPKRVVASLPLRLGWSGQASSSFMWEICNRPIVVAGDQDRRPCARLGSGEAYVQLRYVGGNSALAIAWAEYDTTLQALVEAAQSLAGSLGVPNITCSVLAGDRNELQMLSGQDVALVAQVWEQEV
jgi:GNAT superfamily N-acetyltransferase